ncbi:MAG: hypothetical protein U5L07_00775 [Desulfobacterales bacterium]|nr:hypothetical protein [Desulfobacterales bacterium]
MKLTPWLRDLLIIPIIVGIVIVLFQNVFQYTLKEKKNIEIQLEGPISLNTINELLEDSGFKTKAKYIFEWDGQPKVVSEKKQKSASQATQKLPNKDFEDSHLSSLPPPTMTNLKVTLELEELYAYKVHIENSGDISFKDLLANIKFSADDDNFTAVTYSHFSRPNSMSEDIEHLNSSDSKHVKFKYATFNPGEQDVITVLASGPCSFGVELRGSGYTILKESVFPSDHKEKYWVFYALYGVLGAVISILLSYLTHWRLTRLLQRSAKSRAR